MAHVPRCLAVLLALSLVACSPGEEAGGRPDGDDDAGADADPAMVQLTVTRERLAASGRGEEEPTAANTTPDGADNPDGRQQNRRVEIIIETDEPIPTGL